MGFVDLHAHVLPALDDGAPDPATGLAMLRGLAQVGYEVVTATPHQRAPLYFPSAEAIRAAHADMIGRLAAAGVRLRLALGAENFWDDVLFQRWREQSIPAYDDGRAFLFEIPPEDVPVRLEETLFQLRVEGRLPVMAHPERYVGFQTARARLERLAASVALVVDLGAVAGYHGARPGRVARELLADRVAHAAASDAHAPADVRVAAEGIAWIKKRLGADAARRLLEDNPRAILAGELPEP
jgi:protein-tyrosine phosphatase